MDQAHFVVCIECGARWITHASGNPRRCQTVGCDAGWLDLPMFLNEADADRVADDFAAKRVAATQEP